MKKVLVFGMTDNPGGVESVIMNYYRCIDSNKVHFDFLCNYHEMAYYDEVIARGSKVFFVTPRRENYRQFAKDLDSFMKRYACDYEAIWVNLCSLVNIDYLIAAKKYGVKKRIIHCHNSDNDAGKIKWLVHQINKIRLPHYANIFWSCSDTAAKWFYNEKIINSGDYRFIPNAIDVERFAFDSTVRDEVRAKYGLENKVVIGHVGRFHFQKNHEFLLRVFSELSKKDKSYHLLLVGQGELEEKIREYANKENLGENVTFAGVTLNPEQLYSAMDLFVLPSIFEGLGVVVLEAQANGIPCLCSTGVPRIVSINNNVDFLTLNDGIDKWCTWVLEHKQCGREVNNIMRSSIFDINTQIREMERIIIG